MPLHHNMMIYLNSKLWVAWKSVRLKRRDRGRGSRGRASVDFTVLNAVTTVVRYISLLDWESQLPMQKERKDI